MQLNQIVEINQQGTIHSSVNFGMMEDETINLRLCEGFIFNYDPNKPERSTVGILDKLGYSYHNQTSPNIHCLVQQYGKGKSHFAVTIANFFKQPQDSPQVEKIFNQIEKITGNKPILDKLKAYKKLQGQGHLVICLSGDRGGDLKKQFLQTLLKELEKAQVKDSIAHHICREPLQYLEKLNPQQRSQAETYLRENFPNEGDINTLINLLQNNNVAIIPIVKRIAKNQAGFEPNWDSEIDIETILNDIITNLCQGENPRFSGILIIFDELRYHLESWAENQAKAGGTALQNITNICEQYKSKIALLSLTQIDPNSAHGISPTAKQNYLKIASRVAPKDSTYLPVSSLELVLNGLLIQKDNETWRQFEKQWREQFTNEGRNAFEKRLKIYREKGWSLEQFNTVIVRGCFPLHPLTTYLLAQLDFTQDRTAIEFIKGKVKEFINNEPALKDGKPNYLYSIHLVDTFLENFSHNTSIYKAYQEACNTIAASDDPRELMVLKALFLYYASGDKLTKSDTEDHQEVLTALTGLDRPSLKTTLDRLIKREIIQYRPANKLYKFYEGFNPRQIEDDIEEEIKDQIANLEDLVVDSNINLKFLDLPATTFVEKNKLVPKDWQFEQKYYSIEGLIKALDSDATFRQSSKRGIVAYVLASSATDLQSWRNSIQQYLQESRHQDRFVVAIPEIPTQKLDRVLLSLKTLQNKPLEERHSLGPAVTELEKRWRQEIDQKIKAITESCRYYSILSKVEKEPEPVISKLLQTRYPFVVPVASQDKMATGHTTGAQITGYVAKQLIADQLTPQGLPNQAFYKTVIEALFVTEWGLLKKDSQKYSVKEPTHKNVRAAWDKITEMTDLGGEPVKITPLQKLWETLAAPPYSYNEYTFIVLIAGWLAYHVKEVVLYGSEKLTIKKDEQVSNKEQGLKEWANTDIWQKPKDWIEKWIGTYKAQLIRRQQAKVPTIVSEPIDYDRAINTLEEIKHYLATNDLAKDDLESYEKNRDEIEAQVSKINTWLEPIEQALAADPAIDLSTIINLYQNLQKRPPALNLTGKISVNVTKNQRDRQLQAQNKINELLETKITDLSQEWSTFTTPKEYETYQTKLEPILKQLPTAKIPPHLIDRLREAQKEAEKEKTKLEEKLKQQKQREKQEAADRQTLEKIRNIKPEQRPSIALSEDAINDINNLRQQLNHPQTWDDEIESILSTFRQKIASDRQALSQLQTDLTTVDNQSEFLQLSIQLHKLESVFKDSPDYATYQTLETQIKDITSDFEILRQLEERPQNSLATCQEILDTIERGLFPFKNPDRFQAKIEQIKTKLTEKIATYSQDLENFREQLANLTQLPELQQLHRNILTKHNIYVKSNQEPNYQKLRADVESAIEQARLTSSDLDLTTQIINLFQQLPPEERQKLYEILGQLIIDN